MFIHLFPTNRPSIILIEPFSTLKLCAMGAETAPRIGFSWNNVVQHLVVDNKRDKIVREEGIVKKTVDLNNFQVIEVLPVGHSGSFFPSPLGKLANFNVDSIVEILAVNLVVDRLEIVITTLRDEVFLRECVGIVKPF